MTGDSSKFSFPMLIEGYNQFIKVLLAKVSDMLDSSNVVRLFHRQSFMLYGSRLHGCYYGEEFIRNFTLSQCLAMSCTDNSITLIKAFFDVYRIVYASTDCNLLSQFVVT